MKSLGSPRALQPTQHREITKEKSFGYLEPLRKEGGMGLLREFARHCVPGTGLGVFMRTLLPVLFESFPYFFFLISDGGGGDELRPEVDM